MTNAQEFLMEFNKLETLLRNKESAPTWKSFSELVSTLAPKDAVIRRYKDDLRELGDLRNAIVHMSRSQERPIADPYPETVQHLREILRYISKPQSAYDIATKANLIYTSTLSGELAKVVTTMCQNGYTNVPILAEDGRVSFVLSEYSLLLCVADNAEDGALIVEAATIKHIQKYLDSPTGKDSNASYAYVSSTDTALKVKELFDSALGGQKRLMCVFVTRNGKHNEKLEGIITAWDLSRIK